jgi:hypothetical protein
VFILVALLNFYLAEDRSFPYFYPVRLVNPISSFKQSPMGILFDILQALQFNAFQVIIAGLLLFSAGHLLGKRNSRRLKEKINRLEKNVMELNSEILFGNQETKIINIKKSHQKKKIMAN